MFEFEVIEEIKSNIEMLEILKNCTLTIKNGKVKHLLKTNLQLLSIISYFAMILLEYGSSINLIEKLIKDSTLLQPDEYIFLYANNDSIMQRNKTRGKELSKAWIDTSFTDYQNEFYKTVSRKIPNSRRISTAEKDKIYVSRIIAQILNVQELTDRDL